MDEHGEVADLLGHGVRDDRDRRRNPQRRAGQKRRGDDHAVAEIVHAGADEDHEARATLVDAVRVQRVLVLRLVGFVLVRGVAVRVPPENELLQREEREETREHRGHHPLGIARLERVRQELEEHGAKQRADGERHDARRSTIDAAPACRRRRPSRTRRRQARRRRSALGWSRQGSRLGARQGPWLRGSERIAAGTPHYTHRE